MEAYGIKLQAEPACLYCDRPLQKRRVWEYVDLCTHEEGCDPHGSGDPRRCPKCGSGHFVLICAHKGNSQLQCSVCDSFFESRPVTKRLPAPVPESLGLFRETR